MYLEFIGIGEAFDPESGTSCYLLNSKESTLLIDCGYACLGNLFSKRLSPNKINGIYLTHFHADHVFGLVPLLAAWKAQGRTEPFTIIGQPGTESRVKALMELGYPKTYDKLPYPITFIETTEPLRFKDFNLTFAQSEHGLTNYAVKVKSDNSIIGFSGDGSLTESTMQLFSDCHILVHEAFGLDNSIEGHTTAKEVLRFARTLPDLQTLALVHIQRDERNEKLEEFLKLDNAVPFTVYLPEPGSTLPTRS